MVVILYTILIVVCLLAVVGLAQVPQKWIGLPGLVPIIIGLKVLFEKEDEDKEIIESTNRFRRLFLSVALLSIAAGGDNLGILKQGYTRSIVMTL